VKPFIRTAVRVRCALSAKPVGFQNSATGVDQGFYAARSYSLMRPPRTARRWMLFPGQVRDWVIWPGRVKLAAAMGAPSVVVGLILS
jgi:hypothetical protein